MRIFNDSLERLCKQEATNPANYTLMIEPSLQYLSSTQRVGTAFLRDTQERGKNN